jgi:cyclophilin family peptidyl-prolyl cis-trans isomerase
VRFLSTLLLVLPLVVAGCVADEPEPSDPSPRPSEPAVVPLECGNGTVYPDQNVTVDVVVTNPANLGGAASTFTMRLLGGDAPITVCNFLRYVEEDHYDATIFHRICRGFVIQAGGWESTDPATERAPHDPIINEANQSGLSNVEATVAMARVAEPDSATSHWFVNLRDNTHLDPGGADEWGYAVFAEVVDGWDVIVMIEETATVPEVGQGSCEGRPVPAMEPRIDDIAIKASA